MRRRTGTAGRRLLSSAVDVDIEQLANLSDRECVDLMANWRWGSTKTMPCPHCGTVSAHYWRPKDKRRKCKCCDSTFSVTSKTVYADHKIPLRRLILIVLASVVGASGVPALQNRRLINHSYATIFTTMQKLREGAARGAQTGMLCGVIEMDGMDVLGDRHKERRNVPQVKPVTTKPAIPAHLLVKPEGSPEADPKEDKRKGQSKNPNRRILLNARQRSVVTGRGAVRTYVSVAITESAASVTRMAMPRVSAEASIVTDEDTAYADFGKHFAKHESVKHSAGFSINGINQNQAEGFNKRVERAIKGVHLNISHTHFYGYAADLALKEDLRELPTSKQLAAAMGYALRVGHSRWWTNYTHGVHRGTEILVDGERTARRHGPPKGRHPQGSAGWHPPR